MRDTTDVVGFALLGGMIARGQVAEGWAGGEEGKEIWRELVSHSGRGDILLLQFVKEVRGRRGVEDEIVARGKFRVGVQDFIR